MNKKERAKEVLRLLDLHYPDNTKCFLEHENAHQLLVATILSAQCTDNRVNMVTPDLFLKYPTIEAFANANVSELEEEVRSTGFYRNKARNIKAAMQMLLENYNGQMPCELEELIKLPGVGRKTANVVRCHIFNIPSIVVDTHVKRISNRWGFTENVDPDKIEFDLMKILPKEHWMRYNMQVIAHGRAICKAPTAKCEICFMGDCCPAFKGK